MLPGKSVKDVLCESSHVDTVRTPESGLQDLPPWLETIGDMGQCDSY